MRAQKIPHELIGFMECLLTNRSTHLHFDGFTSNWIPIRNGIGQGNPLLMILYIIYNADLVKVAKPRKGRSTLEELILAFVDDTAFVEIARDFHTTHHILKNMLECPGGGFDWSHAHNSRFETNKFALMDFLMNRTKE
jgi:hypothetical protein